MNQIEDAVEKTPSIPPIQEAVREGIERAHERLATPTEVAASDSARHGFLAMLGEIKDAHMDDFRQLAASDMRALVAGGIAFIPVAGELKAGKTALAELEAAAILEGAGAKQAAALARGAVVKEGGKVGASLASVFGENALEGASKALKQLTPNESVPRFIKLIAAGAEMVGIHGANVIPSAIQLEVNKWKRLGISLTMAKEAAVLMKDRIGEMKSQKVAAAAAAFA